ncbi:MAG: class I SAM-dependent methyltransferase [Anaerolineae bacterium]|nr:class I SAM-dependent methyltransferase [Anaerolineae bacterium]
MNIPNDILKQLFATYRVLDKNNQPRPMASNISAANATRLYQAVKTYRPQSVLEIGLAYGISSLAILTALQEIGQGGTLISIDPYQEISWDNIGLLNIQRAGLKTKHTFINEVDYLALPSLLADGNQFDMVYIDGWHIFDYAMLDFFYTDKMLKVDGVVGFNDTARSGIRRTIKFLKQYRRYQEVKIALPLSTSSQRQSDLQQRLARFTSSGNIAKKLLKSIRYRIASGSVSLADRYFQKVESWEPGDSEYYEFDPLTLKHEV